jgi:hypothetical protein
LEHWHASFEDLRTALARSLERAENSPSWLAGLATALESAAAPEWASLTAFLLDQAQASMSQASAPADFLRRAQALRNRLAHGVGQPRWTADVTATWLDLLEHLHASREQQSDRNALADTEDAPASLSTVWLNVAAQNRREIAPARGPLFEEPAASVECRVDGARPLARHSTVSEEVRSTEPEGSHVRRLHQLLLEQLAGNEILKSSVDRMLTGRGYQGDFELRLLEHCIRIEEPANLLSGIFDLSRLHAMHTQVVGQPADNASGSIELAREILSALGFPEPSECRGPKQVREFVERSEQLVRIKGLPVASAVVHDVARQLEYLCHVLLRFMCQAAFGESPELHLKNRGSIKKPGDLAKSGLGALLIFTEQVIDDLRTAKDPKALVLQRDLGEGALPAGKDALSSVRNSFSHFKPGAPVASEADALAFLQQASQLCTALAKPNSRLLPYVIAIQSLEIDRWGRRTVRALNDEGMDETIFTDEPVRPGEMYLMYPLSNPLRVDPILVPAGDVIWKD